ncbi:serine/threonine protein kinase [Streptomyces sp. NPDC005423]|uniref:serine/threonine protein kinase n=1 Tax=Streptomyces sp. NPDC005423 TaxID=3155343 RepID=UPI0033BF7420
MTAKATAQRQEPVSSQGRPLGTVAGNGTAGFSGDHGPAPLGQLAFPADVAVGGGAVFVADHANHRVRRIDGSGMLTTVAGDGLRGFAGDGADATRARLGFPAALAVGPDGAVLVADEMNHRVRRIDASGIIGTVVGDGVRGGDGDGGPADRARLDAPCALAVDGAGVLYIGEAGTARVRRVGEDGVITTVVEASGLPGQSGRSAHSGAADAGGAFLPAGLATDASGQLYIADPVGRRVLLLRADGTLRVLAGPPDGSAAAAMAVDWSAPCAVAVDAQRAVYIADLTGHRVWRLADGAAHRLAEPTPAAGPADPAETATGGSLTYPCGLAVDPAGRLLVADNFHHRIVALPLTATDPPPLVPEAEAEPQFEREAEPQPDRNPAPANTPKLLVRQEVGVELPRGGGELLHVRVSSTDAWAPGRVTHTFTAPTGLSFDGRATCAYYRVDGSVIAAPHPTAALREGGRSLSVTDEPRLNTAGHPAAALVYTFGVQAGAQAEPGRYRDGRAVIAGQPEVRLTASILEDDDD